MFDRIDHAALMDRVRVRVKDKRVLALVKAFLKAGIMTEFGERDETTELLSRPVDQDRLGSFRLGVLAGPFDQFPVDKGRSSPHERDKVGCVDGAPAVLR